MARRISVAEIVDTSFYDAKRMIFEQESESKVHAYLRKRLGIIWNPPRHIHLDWDGVAMLRGNGKSSHIPEQPKSSILPGEFKSDDDFFKFMEENTRKAKQANDDFSFINGKDGDEL